MQVHWADHDGNRIEELLGVMLCRRFPHANRIRPAQGDGGIDVMVPVGDQRYDIYQIKGFTASLDSSQRTQVKKSLKTIAANEAVTVRDWHLAVPVNPTPAQKLEWFDPLVVDYSFGCHWFGLDQCNILVAEYPEVVRYYLDDGRYQLEKALADIRALADVSSSGSSPAQVVALADLTGPLAGVFEAVNRNDPHYRYELAVTKYPPYTPTSPPPPAPDGLDVAAVVGEQINDSAMVSFIIYPRYAEASVDRPLSGSFQIPLAADGTAANEQAARFLQFGTAAQFTVHNVAMDLPGGLSTDAVEALIHVMPVPSPQAAGYELRLVAVDEDDAALGECVCLMNPATHGYGPSAGIFTSGQSESGLFDLELPMRPQQGTVSMRFHFNEFAGLEPAKMACELWFLYALASAHRIRVGARTGPLADGGMPLEPKPPAMFDQRLLRLVDDLAVIQRERFPDLRYPDSDTIDATTVNAIRIAAALLRGGNVRTKYTEQQFTMPDAKAAQLREQLDVPMRLQFDGAWQGDVFGHLVVIEPIAMQLTSAVLAVDDTEPNLFIATPAEFSDEMLIRPGGTLDPQADTADGQ